MKRLVTLALLLALSCPMWAERVDAPKAVKVAETALQEKELSPVPMEAFRNLYVFNGVHGFAVVAADDCARPLLAYSKDFPFKTENMPENVEGWLMSLDDEIQWAIDQKLAATDETRREWELLSQGIMPEPKHRTGLKPLIKTHWDQNEPYNNLCPGYTPTGCVATAMAQVMKYWEWPRKGTGNHQYTHATYGMQYANFAVTIYDWDNMKEVVYADSPMLQQDAVSKLMYHCGVSVDMDYDPDGSAAFSSEVAGALTSYFDFNSTDIRWQPAADYTSASWVACLENELDNGRPVYYSGKSDGGGHAFICDGYDTRDYLHFNWGWGGYCDGYYAYGALNPGTGGTGSGSGTYNNLNYALLGAHPNTPAIAAPTNFSASVSDRTVTLSWSPVSGASNYKVYRDGFLVNKNIYNNSFTDQEVAYGEHVYAVKAVNSGGDYSLFSETLPVTVTFAGPVPSGLTAAIQSNNVHLSWTAPESESAQLLYGDGEGAGSFGSSSGSGFTWGQRFTPEQLAPYAGMAITSVELFSFKVTNYVLAIYRETETETEVLVSGVFSNPVAGWCEVGLPNPIPIDYESNLLVTFYNDCSDYNYMAAYMEDYEGSANARLYQHNDYWYSIDENISWLIRTNITDGDYTYSIYRNDQPIATNVTRTSYTDNNLPDGNYQYTVRTQYYGNLSESSNTVSVVIGTSVDENDARLLTVYPNPANGKLTVRCENMERIEVVSLTGQQLATMEVNGDHAEVDLDDLQSGVYVLQVHTRDGVRHVTRIAKR